MKARERAVLRYLDEFIRQGRTVTLTYTESGQIGLFVGVEETARGCGATSWEAVINATVGVPLVAQRRQQQGP